MPMQPGIAAANQSHLSGAFGDDGPRDIGKVQHIVLNAENA